jgi:hypothetical protein
MLRTFSHSYLVVNILLFTVMAVAGAQNHVTIPQSGNRRITAVLMGYAYERVAGKPSLAGQTKGPNMQPSEALRDALVRL